MGENSDPTKLRSNPLLGLKCGVAMGVVMLLYAGFRAGSFRFPAEIALTYVSSGVMGGLVVGLCLPLARTRAGASILGVLAVAPFFAVFGALDASASGDIAVPMWAYAASAILVGALSGYAIRDTYHRDLDEPRT